MSTTDLSGHVIDRFNLGIKLDLLVLVYNVGLNLDDFD